MESVLIDISSIVDTQMLGVIAPDLSIIVAFYTWLDL